MITKSRYISLALFNVLFLSCAMPHAFGQSTAAAQQQQPHSAQKQFRPLSLEHLYWHFLVYQHHLDTKAAEQESQGKDGSMLRNSLQRAIGWADADFAPIRASSTRLAAQLKDLDGQAAAIKAAGPPSRASHSRLQVLTAQREAKINDEVSSLRHGLSPDKVKALETLLPQFFPPPSGTPPSTVVPAEQIAPTEVSR